MSVLNGMFGAMVQTCLTHGTIAVPLGERCKGDIFHGADFGANPALDAVCFFNIKGFIIHKAAEERGNFAQNR